MDNRETFTHNNFLKVLNYIIVGLQPRMFYRECFTVNACVFEQTLKFSPSTRFPVNSIMDTFGTNNKSVMIIKVS